eukprot:s254_g13.t7
MADGEPTLLLPDEDCPATQLDEEDETSDHGTTFAKATGFPSPPATPQPRKRKQAPSTGLADTPDKACRRSPRLRELQKLQAEQAPEVPAPAPRRHQVWHRASGSQHFDVHAKAWPENSAEASTGGQKILAEAPLRPVIALSGVEIEANLLNAARRLVESLGGEITNTWTMQATHLVACRLRRTFKIMCALCRGVPIVRPAFIKRCVQEARVSEVRNQDLLRDIIGQQIFAKRFLGRSQRYSLGDVLQRAQDRPLLANYCVYVLPEVTTMERPKLRALVEAAGGQWQEELPAETPFGGSLLVFADAASPAASLAQAASRGAPAGVYQLEALLSAACTQDLRLQAFQMPLHRPSRKHISQERASCNMLMASPGGRTRLRSTWLLACGGLGGSLAALAFLRGPRGVALRARAARQDEVQAPVLQHFIAESPLLRGTKVGGDDAPTVFLVAPPSEQLTKYVLEDPAGPFKGTLEWPERLFDDVDGKNEPDVADHAPGSWKKWSFQFSKREPFMLKADWHGVHGWGEKFDIFVPRKNAVVPVRQAPPRVLALIEAFRKVNTACWQQITSGLQELQEQKPDDILRCRLLKMLIEEFQERGFFGAIEAQAGPARRKEMHWHRDGATGLLHLGITLSGRRRLQLRARSDDDSWTQELWMDAGHVYLSSPFLFEHSITYAAESSDSGPTLALMCRFGFLDEEDALWVNHFRGRDMLEVVELISGCLRNATDAGKLRMPTLSEVSAMEKQLAT